MKIKKLLNGLAYFAICSTIAISCSDDDSRPYYSYGFIPALEINFNTDSIQPVNKATKINITFRLENSCQEFLEFKNLKTSNSADVQDIGIYGAQQNYVPCNNQIQYITKTYLFTPKKAGKNTIRLWKDQAKDGKHLFIEKTILIPEL